MIEAYLFLLTALTYTLLRVGVARIHANIIFGERISGAYGDPDFRSRTKAPVWLVLQALPLVAVPVLLYVYADTSYRPLAYLLSTLHAMGWGALFFRPLLNYWAEWDTGYIGATSTYDKLVVSIAYFFGATPGSMASLLEALLVIGTAAAAIATFPAP